MIIGFTTGVFDMFHIGHLNLLKTAKSKCDILIVGVSTDELVLDYKNKYPIIPYSERFEIVSSITYVDKVVPINDRDKINQYKLYKYNTLFVGDDWKDSIEFNNLEIYLSQFRVNICYLPYTKHISSSKIREVIENLSNSSL
jgi:glycerol-3-phosphate cytidylyltransferase